MSTVAPKAMHQMASRSINFDQRCRGSSKQTGFTYLTLLFAIALIGVGLMGVSEVWTTTARHQQLKQLDWVGEQYVSAIGRYYYANTGSVHYYPKDLGDLLEDKRYLSVKRHLRRLYPVPSTKEAAWDLMPAPGGGIKGLSVHIDDGDSSIERSYVFVPK